jgi:hypothetical protein
MQHTNGKIYGLTSLGGVYDGGVLYTLNVSVKPFVSLVFNAGEVGRSIGILGQGFKGTTTVSFNGTPATLQCSVQHLSSREDSNRGDHRTCNRNDNQAHAEEQQGIPG